MYIFLSAISFSKLWRKVRNDSFPNPKHSLTRRGKSLTVIGGEAQLVSIFPLPLDKNAEHTVGRFSERETLRSNQERRD